MKIIERNDWMSLSYSIGGEVIRPKYNYFAKLVYPNGKIQMETIEWMEKSGPHNILYTYNYTMEAGIKKSIDGIEIWIPLREFIECLYLAEIDIEKIKKGKDE